MLYSNTVKKSAALALVLGLLLIAIPSPAFSQQGDNAIQDLIVNGGFEGGFQEEFGVGYGWGGFSNGNAVVGWNYDDWDVVIVDGQYAQRIEIKDALEQDRYAGVYQTVSVVPGQQYKLTINGLIRSDEGSVSASDYGYRLQYAIDQEGDTAWELLGADAWQEFPWDEQPLSLADNGEYQLQTFDTTITAQSDRLTLFIRGWKKWINQGSGVFNLDEISFVGPAPEGFQAPVAEDATVQNGQQSPEPVEVTAAEVDAAVAPGTESSDEIAAVAESPITAQSQDSSDMAAQEEALAVAQSETSSDDVAPAEAPAITQPNGSNESAAPAEAPVFAQSGNSSDTAANVAQARVAPLPVSGQGDDGSIIYVVIISVVLLLVLFGGAITATVRQNSLAE